MIFKNKTLLITGGTGSFGKTVLKRFLGTDIEKIIIFSRDEKKQEDLRISLNSSKVDFFIGDVRDFDSIDEATKNVDYIFHAAALKQVPSCEFNPMEAYKTNVVGTENVIKASIKNKVKRLVLLSTDKAVYPINAMGISKAMAEKVLVSYSRKKNHSTILCATRYGNVMASRGSVIPLFIDKLKSNEPLTITDPNMTRFLMSLEESLDLVMYAFENGNNGDIFVQKAPSSTVQQLAKVLAEIFNVALNTVIIGARHGEKLYETLVSSEEMSKAVDCGYYYRIPCDSRGLNYDKAIENILLTTSEFDDYTSHNTQILTDEELKSKLLSLDYVSNILR